jgi:hypothetical protein
VAVTIREGKLERAFVVHFEREHLFALPENGPNAAVDFL